jgi:hypothetical protein
MWFLKKIIGGEGSLWLAHHPKKAKNKIKLLPGMHTPKIEDCVTFPLV